MKKIILLLLFLPLFSFSQTTSIDMKWGTGLVYAPGVIYYDDSTIEIQGDTISIMRNLFLEAQRLNALVGAQRLVLDQLNLRSLSNLFKSRQFNRSIDYYKEEKAAYEKAHKAFDKKHGINKQP